LAEEILPPISPIKVKNILYTLNNFKKDNSLKKGKNGILLAYDLADKYYKENTSSTVVIIRDLEASKNKPKILSENIKDKSSKNKLLVSLISIAPEVIKLLK